MIIITPTDMDRKLLMTCCILFGFLVLGKAQITFDPPVLKAGQEATLTFDEPTTQLVVTYRPNSAVAQTDTIDLGGTSSTYIWKPKKAGVVAIHTGNQSMNVSVRYDGVSMSGLLIMVGAGIILFGGVVLAFRTLFRDETEDGAVDINPSSLPDT